MTNPNTDCIKAAADEKPMLFIPMRALNTYTSIVIVAFARGPESRGTWKNSPKSVEKIRPTESINRMIMTGFSEQLADLLIDHLNLVSGLTFGKQDQVHKMRDHIFEVL